MVENPSQQDLIHVEETVREEMQADHAELFVTIRGSSFVAGTAALTKAREVSQLVTDLREAGVSDTEIHLQNVEAEVATGVLGRNSSAAYKLRVECKTLDKLGDVLGAIASQKNAALYRLRWFYPEHETAQDRLLQLCIDRANQKARLIADGLGVRLIGIASFRYHYKASYVPDPDMDPADMREMMQRYGKRSDVAKDEEREAIAINFSHTVELPVSVSVAYRISEIER